MKIAILSFSGRSNGNCSKIGEQAAKAFQGNDVAVFRFSDFTVTPCGRCQNECFTQRERCPYSGDKIRSIYEAVTQSDLAIFIVPNYCDYPNANFFIFNERSQCFFQGRPDLLEAYENVRKKFIVVSNTGTENFTAAFRYQTSGEPEILFLSAKAYGKISLAGDLMESEAAKQAVWEFLAGSREQRRPLETREA